MSLADRICSAAIAGSAFISAAVHALEASRQAAEIARLAAALTNREEAERLHRMVYRVALDEALTSPDLLASTRRRQYLDALHDRAARGESMPETDDDMRRMPEAVRWRAEDMVREAGLG
jgi:hypothetical protein